MSRDSDRYRLYECIGKGGMGEIWRGSRRLGTDARQSVAIKRLRERFAEQDTMIELLAAEARVCMGLAHENLVRVYDFDEIDGRPSLIMEYVDGLTLRELMSHRFPLPEMLRTILVQVLDGLEYIHERGVLHRDISPNNIMIASDGVAKLMDFGVVRVEEGWATRGPLFAGTLPFTAREALEGQELTRSADIYSVGATFFDAVRGYPPYEGASREEIVETMRAKPRPPLPMSVPEDLRAFIEFALGPPEGRTERAVVRAIAAFRRDVGPRLTVDELGKEVEYIIRQRMREEAASQDASKDTQKPALVPVAHLVGPIESTEPIDEPGPDDGIEANEASASVQEIGVPHRRNAWLMAALALAMVLGFAIVLHPRTDGLRTESVAVERAEPIAEPSPEPIAEPISEQLPEPDESRKSSHQDAPGPRRKFAPAPTPDKRTAPRRSVRHTHVDKTASRAPSSWRAHFHMPDRQAARVSTSRTDEPSWHTADVIRSDKY